MKDFRDLKVWEKAHQLAVDLYASTQLFPREEIYGLTSQLRRSAISVPSNIAEGCGRDGDRDLARFLQIAMGSASELEYQLLLAHDLGFMEKTNHEQFSDRIREIKRMLASFLQTLRQKTPEFSTPRSPSNDR